MQQLDREVLPFACLVVGDGSMKLWLEENVEREGLQNQIRFLGELLPDQVHDWMAAGDIIFLPSENEGISLTLYEGMATGLVPVGAKVGGQSELVTPECGILINRGSEEYETEEYSRILAELIRSPEKRQRMGQSSRERVSTLFRLEQMGERMEELLALAKRLRGEAPRQPESQEAAQLMARQAVEYMRSMKAYWDEKNEDTRVINNLQQAFQDQKAEVFRLEQLVHEYAQENARLIENPPMPPAPARTYLYFRDKEGGLPISIGVWEHRIIIG